MEDRQVEQDKPNGKQIEPKKCKQNEKQKGMKKNKNVGKGADSTKDNTTQTKKDSAKEKELQIKLVKTDGKGNAMKGDTHNEKNTSKITTQEYGKRKQKSDESRTDPKKMKADKLPGGGIEEKKKKTEVRSTSESIKNEETILDKIMNDISETFCQPPCVSPIRDFTPPPCSPPPGIVPPFEETIDAVSSLNNKPFEVTYDRALRS